MGIRLDKDRERKAAAVAPAGTEAVVSRKVAEEARRERCRGGIKQCSVSRLEKKKSQLTDKRPCQEIKSWLVERRDLGSQGKGVRKRERERGK